VPPELTEIGDAIDGLAAEVTGTLDEIRVAAQGIHPAVLTKKGLDAALCVLSRRSAIPVRLDIKPHGRIPRHVETSAYYVVAEALTNAAKHAHASTVTVTVEANTTDAVLRIAVSDDGVGGADFTHGTGLTGLKDRVEALNGRFLLDSPHGAGTTVRMALPLATTP
jgi:signal transduction histidine kinase